MTRFKRICANAALVITSLIVGIVFCEVGLRMLGFPSPSEFKTLRKGYAPQFYYASDAVNGHDISKNMTTDIFFLPDYVRTYGAPFTVSSNSVGCRDRSFDPQDDYVLLLGDSVTEGYVAFEQTWGTLLENLIGVRVLKCGVSGYGSRHERHKLEAVTTLAGRPRFVIVGHVWNDILDDYLYPGRTVIEGYMLDKVLLADPLQGGRLVRSDEALRTRLKNRLEPHFGPIGRAKLLLSNYSILYDRVENSEALQRVASWLGFAVLSNRRSELDAFQGVTDFPWLEQAWEEHLENLRQLRSAVEALEATMLVVIFPDRRQLYDSLRPQKGNLQWEYPNQRLTEFLQRERIVYVDLLPEFRRYVACRGRSMPRTPDDLFWVFDDHPNVTGNRLAGLLIGREVLEQSFLQFEDKDTRLTHINQLLSTEDRCRSMPSSQ